MQTAKADSRALRHVLGLCVLFYPSMALCDIVVWICPLRQWICVLLSLDVCSSSLDLCVFLIWICGLTGFVRCCALDLSSTSMDFCFVVLDLCSPSMDLCLVVLWISVSFHGFVRCCSLDLSSTSMDLFFVLLFVLFFNVVFFSLCSHSMEMCF